MQFLPATWRECGMGGDIDEPRDAILAAANYHRRSGAPDDLDRALFAYNHSTSYVRAIRRFAARMRTDKRAFLSYYAWQATSARRTGPGGSPAPASMSLAATGRHSSRKNRGANRGGP
jgi:hypothetical protein